MSELSDLTVAELKELLKEAGLPVSGKKADLIARLEDCLLYTSPSPRDGLLSRMPSSA